MDKITIRLGGETYRGLPLTLDALEQVRALPADKFDIGLLRAFLADEATEPKPTGPVRSNFTEIVAAARAIMGMSALLGEAKAGSE